VIAGDIPDAMLKEGKLQELLQQYQQASGSTQAHIPKGGQEVTPHTG